MTRRAVALGALVLLGAAVSSCRSESNPGACVIGPCLPHVGQFTTLLVIGFPSSRVATDTGVLNPGDTAGLYVVRIPSGSGSLCSATDTVRDSLRWGVTDTNVATVTAMPDGRGLLRAKTKGTFNVLMLRDASGTISSTLPPQYVAGCPSGREFKDFRVAP